MNKQSENPMGPLSPELRAKFEKLVKPHWTQKQQTLGMSTEDAEEFWNEMLDEFGTSQTGAFGHYIEGAGLLEEYPNFVNALTTVEALEIQRILKSGLDARLDATLAKITKALRLPNE